MKSFLFSLLFLLLTNGSALAAGEATTPLPSPEQLIKRAPVISLANEDIQSYQVTGYLDFEQMQLGFILLGSRPDKETLLLYDLRDQAPLVAAMAGTCLLYDPINSNLLMGPGHAAYELKIVREESGERNLSMEFIFQAKKEEDNELTTIDIRSLLLALDKEIEVKHQADGQLTLSGNSNSGSRLIAYLDPERPAGAFQKVEIFQAGHPKPSLVLSAISLNRPIPAWRFNFPEEQVVASQIPRQQFTTGPGLKGLLSMGKLVRTLMARLVLAGLDAPDIKAAIEKVSLRPLDWQQLKAQDQKVAAQLKEIFADHLPH